MLTIDISGPHGNAYSILARVKQYGKDLGWDKDKIEAVQNEMTSGDYDNLCAVFNREFDGIVKLVNDYDDEEVDIF